MSGMGLDAFNLQVGAQDWADLSEAMSTASTELSGASTGGLAPSVTGAAQSFLSSWAGYADESSTIASGFSDALEASITTYGQTDEQSQRDFSDLDGRLGPAT